MTYQDVATESYNFWNHLCAHKCQVWALLGNEDGETSFRPGVVGDKGAAYGPFQHHIGRITAMMMGCGIDVRIANHLDQLKAAHWEMTVGSYRHVWPALMNTDTVWSAVGILVQKYEQSASQNSDIQKRVKLAEHWANVFGDK